MHVVRVDGARREDLLLDLDHRDPGRHRHYRIEITLRPPEAEIARRVRLIGTDKGVIERQRVLQQVLAAIEETRFPAFRKLGADRGGGKESRDPCASRTHPLGERALRDELGFDQTLIDIFSQHQPLRSPRRRGESADHFLDLSVPDHLPHIGCVVGQGGAAARRVRHAGQILRTLLGHGLVEVDRHPHHREPAEADRGSVRDVANRIVKARIDLVLGAHSPARHLLFLSTSHHAAGDARRQPAPNTCRP